jgi:hypothetical protein
MCLFVFAQDVKQRFLTREQLTSAVTIFHVEIEGSAVGTPHRDKLMFWCVSQTVWTFVLYCVCLFDELLAASMFSLFRDALIQHSRFEFTFFTPGLFSAVDGVCISPLSFLLAHWHFAQVW